MKVLVNGEIIGEISTNHSMTIDEALDLLNCEKVEDENEGTHYKDENGNEFWYEDVELEG